MENITEKDPIWKQNGTQFVDSVTKLLERLLDYRSVMQVISKDIKEILFIFLRRVGIYSHGYNKCRHKQRNHFITSTINNSKLKYLAFCLKAFFQRTIYNLHQIARICKRYNNKNDPKRKNIKDILRLDTSCLKLAAQ